MFPVLALLITVILRVDAIVNQDEIERAQFREWNEKFKKKYESSASERKAIRNLMAHKKEVDAHNLRFRARMETYSRGLWEQSDLSFEEQEKLLAVSSFNASQITLQGPSKKMKKKLTPGEKQVNWIKAGHVNPVENQRKCGSCFAFAAVGVAEGVLLKKGIKTKLSVQQIVDCDKMDDGCQGLKEFNYSQSSKKHFLGGDPLLAFRYMKTNGIASAESYPYSGQQGRCKNVRDTNAPITSVAREKLNGNEERLKSIVSNFGPVAVAVNAARSFSNYRSGVYTNPKCPKVLNHAVLLVGYGFDEKTKLDYWLVKNSWVKSNKLKIEEESERSL